MAINQTNFYVISSSGTGGYAVTFAWTPSSHTLSVYCNCPAGIHGQLCKHKLALITGDDSIYDPDMEDGGFAPDKWSKVMGWVQESGMYGFVQDYQDRMKKLEAEKRRIHTQIKNEKARLARLLSEGVCR